MITKTNGRFYFEGAGCGRESSTNSVLDRGSAVVAAFISAPLYFYVGAPGDRLSLAEPKLENWALVSQLH